MLDIIKTLLKTLFKTNHHVVYVKPKVTVTAEDLSLIMKCNTQTALKYSDSINNAMCKFEINSFERVCAFLAQIGHESGGLKYTKEIWGPTLSQQMYEGRSDLGNTEKGDGKRFMGRGVIQITGRANYTQVAEGLGIDCVNNPSLLELPENAVASAAWWWKSKGLNELADNGEFKKITRRINGGYNGLKDRMERFEKAKDVLKRFKEIS